MHNLLEFLNNNSGALSAIFSGVVTLATIFYAWLTARLVSETRQMRQVQTEPRIQVIYQTRDEWINFLDISVKNIGLGPAKNVRFSVRATSDNPGAHELVKSLTKLGALKNGLAYLGPGHQFSSFWTSLVEGGADKVDSHIEVKCTYESVTGRNYEQNFVLDLSELKGSSSIGEPPLLKIAKHIETIEKDIHSAIKGFERLSVNVYSEEDRATQRAAIKERHRQAQAQRVIADESVDK